MALTTLTATQRKGLGAILDWGFKNFHLLKEDNKVKMFLKIYDKIEPDKMELSLSLSDAVKAARQRALSRIT